MRWLRRDCNKPEEVIFTQNAPCYLLDVTMTSCSRTAICVIQMQTVDYYVNTAPEADMTVFKTYNVNPDAARDPFKDSNYELKSKEIC